jgi:hypothetical protein
MLFFTTRLYNAWSKSGYRKLPAMFKYFNFLFFIAIACNMAFKPTVPIIFYPICNSFRLKSLSKRRSATA